MKGSNSDTKKDEGECRKHNIKQHDDDDDDDDDASFILISISISVTIKRGDGEVGMSKLRATFCIKDR